MTTTDGRALKAHHIERLEPRQLLAGFTASVDTSNVLTIFGTASDDVITLNKLSSGQVSITGVTKRFTPGSKSGQFKTLRIFAGAGNDTVTINSNVPYTSSKIDGEAGNDLLVGGSFNDTINGDVGKDTMKGNDGNDFFSAADGFVDNIDGGKGTNTRVVDVGPAVKDVVINAKSQSVAFGADSVDGTGFAVMGTAGADKIDVSVDRHNVLTVVINGQTLTNTPEERIAYLRSLPGNKDLPDYSANIILVFGESGNDTINGGSGVDHIFGNAGNDKITGGMYSVAGGVGNDSINSPLANTIYGDRGGLDRTDKGSDGNDTIVSGNAGTIIYGGGGSDSIKAGSGNDSIVADGDFGADDSEDNGLPFTPATNPGNDTITGGSGKDLMDGGAGNDVFYNADGFQDTVIGGAGTDTAHKATGDGDVIASDVEKLI